MGGEGGCEIFFCKNSQKEEGGEPSKIEGLPLPTNCNLALAISWARHHHVKNSILSNKSISYWLAW